MFIELIQLSLNGNTCKRSVLVRKQVWFEHWPCVALILPVSLDSTTANTPAEIQLTPDKKYLLVSNRGDNNLVVYKINDHGKDILTVKEHLDSRGAVPRYFEFDPTGRFLLVANKRSNNLICFSYDHHQGAFQFVSELKDLNTAQHLVFLV